MKQKTNIGISAGLILLIFSVQSAGQVTRKPYLQIPAPSSIVVRWQTGTGAISNLYYGSSISSLTRIVPESNEEKIYHEVQVSGLQPSTKYYYSVTASDEGLEDQYFITPPVPGKTSPVRIWVISDFGQTSSKMNARRVETVERWGTFNNNSYHASFVLSLGDQTEDDAVYQIQHNYFDQLEKVFINTPVYTAIGNHDNHDSLYNYIRTYTLPENGEAGGIPSGTPKYYSFDYSDIHVVVLCTEMDEEGIKTQTRWLESDLEHNHREWLLACLHQPFHSGGHHNSDNEASIQNMRNEWLPLLFKYDVDLILQGHNHIYERSYLVKDLIGKAMEISDANKVDAGSGREDEGKPYHKKAGKPDQGAVFVTVAAGGVANPSPLFVHYRMFPVYYSAPGVEGSLVVDINDNKLNLWFLCNEINPEGSYVWDQFTIIKN